MISSRIRGAMVALAASAGLAACTSYGPYGGSSVGVGVSYGSGYGGYGYGSPYGYGYGSPYYASYPYYGWYDGFYYPGAGYWLYDPWGHRHPMTKRHSDYWRNVLKKIRDARGDNVALKENFSGFEAQAKAPATADQRRSLESIRQRVAAQRAQDIAPPHGLEQRQMRVERQQQRSQMQQQQQQQHQARAERQQARAERQESLRQQVLERRQSRGTRKPTDE